MAGSRGPKEAALRRAAGGTEPLDLPGSLLGREARHCLGRRIALHCLPRSCRNALMGGCHCLQELGGAAREFRLGLDSAQSLGGRLRAAVGSDTLSWEGRGKPAGLGKICSQM